MLINEAAIREVVSRGLPADFDQDNHGPALTETSSGCALSHRVASEAQGDAGDDEARGIQAAQRFPADPRCVCRRRAQRWQARPSLRPHAGIRDRSPNQCRSRPSEICSDLARAKLGPFVVHGLVQSCIRTRRRSVHRRTRLLPSLRRYRARARRARNRRCAHCNRSEGRAMSRSRSLPSYEQSAAATTRSSKPGTRAAISVKPPNDSTALFDYPNSCHDCCMP